MHTREFIKSHEPIYKIGRSNILDNRVKQYPNGSNILLMIKCKNSILCENNLIKLFKEKFIQKKYYGTEYFEGNCYDMIKEICNYIKNIDNNKKVEKVKKNTKEEKQVDRTCNNCKHTFRFPSDLKTHFTTSFHCKKNNEDIELFFDNINNNIIKTKIFNCITCSKEFSRKYSLERHKTNSNCLKS